MGRGACGDGVARERAVPRFSAPAPRANTKRTAFTALVHTPVAGSHVGAVVDDSVVATGGWTPLHYAVYFCVESHMKDVDTTYGGAKRSNADAVVRLLIERGAPLDTQSRASHSLNPQRVVVGGSTPRDIAIACENADVAVAVAAIIDHAVAKRDAARAALLGA